MFSSAIIGLSGEQVVSNFRFYAVFPDNEEYTVRDESREIGCVFSSPPKGERFALSGRTWEVLDIDVNRKTIYAKQVKGKVKTSWNGGSGSIHTTCESHKVYYFYTIKSSGFFTSDTSDIRVVIELKETNTNLEKKRKNRESKMASMDQTLLYASKRPFGGVLLC